MGTFYEFFAGGGMARAGLGPEWTCLFANDFDRKKAATYAANWGSKNLRVEDVSKLTSDDLPDCADLAWASFPCQDLSLAGAGAGLNGERSGTFWPFWRHVKALKRENRAPRLIVLENVCGALSSYKGKDFAAIANAISGEGYCFGAVVIDASLFVPQSRQRLFIIAIAQDCHAPSSLHSQIPNRLWHPTNLVAAYRKLSKSVKENWVWWQLPEPSPRKTVFADLIEDKPRGVRWHTAQETQQLLDMMSQINLQKVETAKKIGKRVVGGIYKRTRVDEAGNRVQRAEIRFDDIAGCLRTPGGGSSRQFIMIVDGDHVRTRLLSPREAARLMGLPEEYKLPLSYNEAYHLAGDGLVVPVVRFLSEHLLEPLQAIPSQRSRKAA